MFFKKAIRVVLLVISGSLVGSAFISGCGGPKGACENPGNNCANYSKGDCKSGTFTEGKTCEDLGYHCDSASNGTSCKK